MKKFLFFLSLLILIPIKNFSQEYKYAWISDLHIGSPGADSDLRAVVENINNLNEIDFVVATGDISEKGLNSELELAKQILDGLNKKYYIIPGNHDTKWSESGCTKFKDLWGDDKFVFDSKGIKHIGINSGIPWRGGGGHISVEDLDWLKSVLENTPADAKIFLYVHHPLDGDVDNWYKATNLLAGRSIKAVFVGHGHSNRLMNFAGIPAVMGRSTLSRPKYAGFTIVEAEKDSLNFYEAKIDSTPLYWGSILLNKDAIVNKIDSTDFNKYSDKAEILWQKSINKTCSASLLPVKNGMISASISGEVTCFDLQGKVIWRSNLGRTIFSRPAVDNGVLAIATIEGDLITINSNTGEILQTLGINDALTSQLIITEIKWSGEKVKTVIAGTASGKLYCYELNNLEFLWENYSAKLMIETMPLIVDNKIIFGSWDNYLYCIDRNNGSLIWQWTENKNFYYSPAACWPVTDGKNVFISTPDKYISAIDVNLGTTTWRRNDFNSWESIGISGDKKQVFVKSILDKFFIISPSNGKLIKEIKIGYSLDTMPNQIIESNGNIIFGCKNGIVYLIDKYQKAIPLFYMGTSRIHSIQNISKNIFAASNMDGNIVLFSIKQGLK